MPINLLVGRKLEYVRLDHVTALGFSGGYEVLIESPTTLNGHVVIEPEAFETLLGDVVEAARARDTGELEIILAGGCELLVATDADFESWAVAGPGGPLVVCLPRGELAIWDEAAIRPAAA